MNTQRFDIWVAAAAFLIAKGELHIEDLTQRILASELTVLGLKGDTPPRQTVSSQLSLRNEIFYHDESRRDGSRGVWNSDEVLRNPQVAACYRLIAASGG